MSSCPNCGKEISQNSSFCPYCQKYTSEKAEKKMKNKGTNIPRINDVPRLIAIFTFFYQFIVLFVFVLFTQRLEITDLRIWTLLFELFMPFLILYTIIKKPRFFRFLSLFFNLMVILRYAIWVNTIGFIR